MPISESKSGNVSIYFGSAESLYDEWPVPVCIISDGPYGVNGFPGDHKKPETLANWYRPHIEAWSRRATPQTTLWFWNTEIGWAMVHPVLAELGWEYRCCNIWDKGLGHIAGNCNTQTLRMFPIVTEVCVQYMKSAKFGFNGYSLSMQEWLRQEWQRSDLPLKLANKACGVKNAATRKYLTEDHLWYFPPAEAFTRMADYANRHGNPKGRPYFSLNGRESIPPRTWEAMRAKFRCEPGVTNVWREPQVGGNERIQGERSGMRYKFKSLHGSQKPLRLIELIIRASTDHGDVVWEPFGGLCPGAIASHRLNRVYCGAEILSEFFTAAKERLKSECRNRCLFPSELSHQVIGNI